MIDLGGNKGCFPAFNHWSSFRSWLIGLSLQPEKKSRRSRRTRHGLTSITERAPAHGSRAAADIHTRKSAADVSSRHTSHNLGRGRPPTAWWDRFRWHADPNSPTFLKWLLVFFFFLFIVDVSPILCSLILASSTRPTHSFTHSRFTETSHLLLWLYFCRAWGAFYENGKRIMGTILSL